MTEDQKEINRLLNIAFATENINYYLNQKQTMEKQIKMSLETARELWKNVTDMSVPVRQGDAPSKRETSPLESSIKNMLLENFTKEELEGKKGFTWEDSFNGNGWYLHNHGQLCIVNEVSASKGNVNVFKTKKQAESALAFAQLSHIVAKYNEGKDPLKEGPMNMFCWFYVFVTSDGRLEYGKWQNSELDGPDIVPLKFNRREDANTSIMVNAELWNKYWQIK